MCSIWPYGWLNIPGCNSRQTIFGNAGDADCIRHLGSKTQTVVNISMQTVLQIQGTKNSIIWRALHHMYRMCENEYSRSVLAGKTQFFVQRVSWSISISSYALTELVRLLSALMTQESVFEQYLSGTQFRPVEPCSPLLHPRTSMVLPPDAFHLWLQGPKRYAYCKALPSYGGRNAYLVVDLEAELHRLNCLNPFSRSQASQDPCLNCCPHDACEDGVGFVMHAFWPWHLMMHTPFAQAPDGHCLWGTACMPSPAEHQTVRLAKSPFASRLLYAW